MTPIEQVHNWSNFSGWEWDGFYLWPKWSYRLWKNIDTRQLENWVKICTKVVDTEVTYDWDILAVNPYALNSFSTDTWSWWKIYKDWVLKITLASWTAPHNAIMWFGKMTKLSDTTTYVYWFSQTSVWVWKIFRIATNYSTATDISQDFTLALWKTDNSNYMPVLSLPWKIIFWYWNTIYELSNWEILTELISFPKDSEIVAITYYQDIFKIYYNVPNYSGWPKNSFVNYWDWSSSAVETFVVYENSWVFQVINDWAFDYAVFGNSFSNDFYRMEGLNRVDVRVNTENSANNTRLLWAEWVIREWVIYLTWQNKLEEDCLYSFGNYYPWMSKSLMPENSGIEINKMYAWISDLYIYIDDVSAPWTGAIYTKSFLFSWNTELSWTIYSYAITWNFWMYTQKSIKEIDVSYYLPASSSSIKVYVKTSWWPTADNATGRTLIKTITDHLSRWVKIYASELSTLSVWKFYQLEYKVELITTSTSWPYLHQIRTVYNDNIQ